MSTQPESAIAVTGDQWVIEPRAQKLWAQLREIWVYRRLFKFFGKRIIERRYRGTLLGGVWLFRPLFPLLVRALIFGGVLGVDAPGSVPYFLFVLVGSSVWDLFASSLMWSMRSLQVNRGSMGRMYFPHVIVPFASTALAFLNFLILMGVAAWVLGYYYVTKGQWFLAGPEHLVFALIAIVLAVGMGVAVGLFAAPFAAEYRDLRYGLTYLLELWALVTPILYPLSKISAQYHWIVFLNPLAGVVQAFKWGVLGVEEMNGTALVIDGVLVTIVLSVALWYFNRVEAQAMDKA